MFLRFALDHPDLVCGLVLVDTSARAEPADHAAAVKANLDRLREASDEERATFVREMAIPAFFAQPWCDAHPEEVEREIALRLRHDPVGYELAVRAVVDRLPLDLERLAGIKVPVAVVVGVLDQLTPIDHSRGLYGAIRGATLTIVPDAGHHTPIEQPEHVTAAIEALPALAF